MEVAHDLTWQGRLRTSLTRWRATVLMAEVVRPLLFSLRALRCHAAALHASGDALHRVGLLDAPPPAPTPWMSRQPPD